jgi:hypothetical protein
MNSRHFWGIVSYAALLCSAACAPASLRSATVPAAPAIVAPTGVPAAAGPFLYVAGAKLSEYALGSSEPVRSTKVNWYATSPYLALDGHGHLCESNGDVSAAQLLEYDASTLKLLQGLNGVGDYYALVADRLGYLYATTGQSVIYVYAPGCLQRVNVIRGGGFFGYSALVFDRSGKLYAANPNQVNVYAPTAPGHMKFVRHIRDGINSPFALATGPSGDLVVANSDYVTIYRPGASQPVRRITNGSEDPGALAVDSKGWLYVANTPPRLGACGWVSVYGPGDTKPVRKITDQICVPGSLAIDPSDNLYVMNTYAGHQHGRQSVTVYAPHGTKLLRKITKGIYLGNMLLIGSP